MQKWSRHTLQPPLTIPSPDTHRCTHLRDLVAGGVNGQRLHLLAVLPCLLVVLDHQQGDGTQDVSAQVDVDRHIPAQHAVA